jgi:hypothetical protein
MTTDRHGVAARLLRWGAGPLAVVGLVAGCSSSEGATSTSVPAVTQVAGSAPVPTAASTPASTSAPAGSAPEPTVVELAEPDGPALLQQVFADASGGYHFVTTVTVGDAVALTAEGDRVGDGTRLSVVSNDATVDYVITPTGSWVGQSGVWQELDEPAPVTDPLAALADPSAIRVSAFDASGATLIATYPASALSLPGDGSIDVTVEIDGTRLSALAYTAPDSDPPAQVRTVLTALTDTSPVTVPAA